MSKVWTTRDGTRIAVTAMDDSHVRNARNMMRRNADRLEFEELEDPSNWEKRGRRVDRVLHWVDTFNAELERRGLPV